MVFTACSFSSFSFPLNGESISIKGIPDFPLARFPGKLEVGGRRDELQQQRQRRRRSVSVNFSLTLMAAKKKPRMNLFLSSYKLGEFLSQAQLLSPFLLVFQHLLPSELR